MVGGDADQKTSLTHGQVCVDLLAWTHGGLVVSVWCL